MKRILYLCVLLCGCQSFVSAQATRILHGVIKDTDTNELIAGATITAKNGGTTTLTDSSGSFAIQIMEHDALLITHISYVQKSIATGESSFLSITLQRKGVLLDDLVINTGYQKLNPNEVNGSYELVDNKLINQQTSGNIIDRLKGVTNGLLYNVGKTNNNPQNNTNISIRGHSTINGPLDPLIVVDNFIYDGELTNIDPNDVESVTILKDAAAASIWGSRAGNGVIVITLKKARLNQPTQIRFNSSAILTDKPALDAMSIISVEDFIGFEQRLHQEGYYRAMFTDFTRPAISPAVQVFEDRKNGLISAEDSALKIASLKQIDNRKQFYDYFYKKGLEQRYAVDLQGGTNKFTWLISGNYAGTSDNLRSVGEKINARIENSYLPVKGLQIGVSAFYSNTSRLSGMPNYESTVRVNGAQIPYVPLVNANGEAVAVPTFYDPRYLDTAGNGKLMDWNYYPLTDYKHARTKSDGTLMLANFNVSYTIMKGISLQLLAQYGTQQVQTDIHFDTSSYYTRNLINSYSQLDRTTGVVDYIIPKGGILNKNLAKSVSFNLRTQLNIARKVNNHFFNVIGGLEVRNSTNNGHETRFYGYNPDPLSYVSNLDYSTRYPHFITDNRSAIPVLTSMSSLTNRFVSAFSNASYTYLNRYTLSASGRRDGANIFGVAVNEKWKPLWSIGLGWNIVNESFYNLNWLPHLRFSVTHGVSGNVDLSRSAMPVGKISVIDESTLPFLQILTLNNPRLSWEQAYQTNFKIDFSLKNDILSGSIEYYLKKGRQLYGPMLYDYTTWGLVRTITANAANMSGNGIDVILRSRNINRKLKWNTHYILNANRSIVTDYFAGNENPTSVLVGNRGNTISAVVGKPLYAIAAYKWAGLDENGNPTGYLDGNISTDYNAIFRSARSEKDEDRNYTYIGPATPSVYGSVLNELQLNGLALSFNITYKTGYYLFKPNLSYTSLARNGFSSAEYEDRWQQSGDEKRTNVPSFVYPLNENRDAFYNSAEVNVIKGDHIRLQFINVSYSFMRHNNRHFFKSIDVYLNASNLGILWKANKAGIDPDFRGVMPDPRNYTIGFRFSL